MRVMGFNNIYRLLWELGKKMVSKISKLHFKNFEHNITKECKSFLFSIYSKQNVQLLYEF